MTDPLTRITYVEDEPDIRAIAEIALGIIGGFTLDVCPSGREALERAPSFRPDLFLLDVMMPGLDGPSTLKALRNLRQFGETPVIFMTAKAQNHEVAAYRELGAVDVIPKPFDPMTLSAEVLAIWSRCVEDRRLSA
jgi:DNA-binding response OmpR family regulator